MFKSKLQELCHQKGWELPQYSVIKDGPDHNPSFTATVTVCDLPFQASYHSRTAKEAHNKAAMAAFHYFSRIPSVAPAASDIDRHKKILAHPTPPGLFSFVLLTLAS